MTLSTSRGSSVATDLQIDAPPRLSFGGLDGDAVPVQMPDGGHYVARDVDVPGADSAATPLARGKDADARS